MSLERTFLWIYLQFIKVHAKKDQMPIFQEILWVYARLRHVSLSGITTLIRRRANAVHIAISNRI
jgi:hypothetical protein